MTLPETTSLQALATLVTLAQHDDRLTLRAIAAEPGMSPAGLRRVLPRLRRAGLVDATPGRAGGYRLAQPAFRISVRDVVAACEPPHPPGDAAMAGLALDVDRVLDRTSIAELAGIPSAPLRFPAVR